MIAAQSPLPFFVDLQGLPLQGGSLYFGVKNQNPETSPIAVSWDVGGTQPAQQPIPTINGYPARAGAPAPVYVGSDYSLTVKDSNGQFCLYMPDSSEYSLWSAVEGTPGGSVYVVEEQTATAWQTVFNLGTTYAPGTNSLSVVAVGVGELGSADYTETSPTVVTMAEGVPAGTVMRFKIGRFVSSGMESSVVSYSAPGTGATALSVAEKLALQGADLEDYGGAADGTTDNAIAFSRALAAGHKVIRAPAVGVYRFASGITIPDGAALYGGLFLPDGNLLGTVLKFDLSVPTCVTLGGATANNRAADISGVSITREAGVIPAGSVGLLVQNSYGVNIRDLQVIRSAIPVAVRGDGTVYGIAANFDSLYTGVATDTHIEVDSFPEVRISNSRIGMNGAADQACNSFIRVKGGSAVNPSNGPNTLVCSNVQFSHGSGAAVGAWVDFKDLLPGNVADVSSWQFDSCFVEVAGTGIRTDASWTNLLRLQISNTTFNRDASAPFLSLNAATQINNWTIGDTIINGSFTTAPTPQINFLHLDNVQILGAASFTGPTSGSVASLSDCNFQAGLTLAGTWASLQVQGGAMSGGTFVNTATSAIGGVSIDLYPMNAEQTFTPALQFAGASTGITYSVQAGAWSYKGNKVTGQLRITLTNKGSASGGPSIALTGLPQPSISGFSLGNSGNVAYASNLSGLSSPVFGTVGLGPIINLLQYGATGLAGLSEANFTNTTDLAIAFEYYI